MQIFQRTQVHTYEYPFAEKLNPKLHNIILKKAVNRDFGATMTTWAECFHIKEFRTLADWVYKVILGFNEQVKIDSIFDLKLKELWGQYYKKGDYQINHHHHPNSWSFVYFVKAPKGSAPLLFTSSNKKIVPKSGMLVVFPSWVYHYVPKHKCEEIRSIVSGDFVYTVDWENHLQAQQAKGHRGDFK